jgi:hypothetical protein
MEEPLPRPSGCHNITCRWREQLEVGREEKEESPQRAHQPRNRGRPNLIINKAGKKRKSGEAKAQDNNHIIVAKSSRMLRRLLILGGVDASISNEVGMSRSRGKVEPGNGPVG